MRLRQRLNKATLADPNDCFDIIWDLSSSDCIPEDVTTLMRIRKARASDKLAFLGLEADSWLRENIKVLRKRFA